MAITCFLASLYQSTKMLNKRGVMLNVIVKVYIYVNPQSNASCRHYLL